MLVLTLPLKVAEVLSVPLLVFEKIVMWKVGVRLGPLHAENTNVGFTRSRTRDLGALGVRFTGAWGGNGCLFVASH
jgi:hypothetical protein